jgi:hypothetical protein
MTKRCAASVFVLAVLSLIGRSAGGLSAQSAAPAASARYLTPPQVIVDILDAAPIPEGTLYLPAGYQEGTRLPLLMWAYPREFTSAASAGQVTGSPNRFTTVTGPSHLLLLTQGYAILDNPKIQSERLYMAIKGNGGTSRYVTLPYEAHGYAARETNLHVVAEMLNWSDKYLKQATPRPAPAPTTSSSPASAEGVH